jgi:hypothetical protein
MSVPENVYLYHLTSVGNLPSIVKNGGLRCKNQLIQDDTDHQNIAYRDIQSRRAEKSVPCAEGGYLHDYVPFYFGPRPPMLLTIKSGNVDGYDEGQEPIVHLVTKVAWVVDQGLSFAFTDRHAVLTLARFYDDASDLDVVDHSIMNDKYWNNTPQYPERKERRQAEFLIHDTCPLSLIGAVGTVNETMAERARRCLESLDSPPPVIVRQNWYY